MGAIVGCSLCCLSPIFAFLCILTVSASQFGAGILGILALGLSLNAIYWSATRASNEAIHSDGVTPEGTQSHLTVGVSLCWMGIFPLLLLPLIYDAVGGVTTSSGGTNTSGLWAIVIVGVVCFAVIWGVIWSTTHHIYDLSKTESVLIFSTTAVSGITCLLFAFGGDWLEVDERITLVVLGVLPPFEALFAVYIIFSDKHSDEKRILVAILGILVPLAIFLPVTGWCQNSSNLWVDTYVTMPVAAMGYVIVLFGLTLLLLLSYIKRRNDLNESIENEDERVIRTRDEVFCVAWCFIMLPMSTALPVSLLFVSTAKGILWGLLAACLLPGLGLVIKFVAIPFIPPILADLRNVCQAIIGQPGALLTIDTSAIHDISTGTIFIMALISAVGVLLALNRLDLKPGRWAILIIIIVSIPLFIVFGLGGGRMRHGGKWILGSIGCFLLPLGVF